MEKFQESENKALIEFVERTHTATAIDATRGDSSKAPILVVPTRDGLKLQSLKPFVDEYLQRPERRKGTATTTVLDSFIAHTKRFADEHSALFACDNERAPSLTTVFDYHEKTAGGAPRFGEHRCSYSFPVSDEWKAWTSGGLEGLGQADFAEFLEKHVGDIIDPASVGEGCRAVAESLGIVLAGPTRILETSRGLSIRADVKVTQVVNLSTGEVQLAYDETHTNRGDGGPIKIPNGFVIAIPVFRGDALYQVPVRMRYRHRNGAITWTLAPHRPEQSFRDAFEGACQRAATETGLPLFYGAPEATTR